MMNRAASVLIVCLLSGCASHAPVAATRPASHGAVSVTPPASQPIAMVGNENLTLDQIQPSPVLQPKVATTQGDAQAPVEAVRLFAQSRIAMLDGNRAGAINLLEKAV